MGIRWRGNVHYGIAPSSFFNFISSLNFQQITSGACLLPWNEPRAHSTWRAYSWLVCSFGFQALPCERRRWDISSNRMFGNANAQG